MKQTLYFFVIAATCAIVSCKSPQTNQNVNVEQAEVAIDTLAQKLHQLDSALNCGSLIHVDIYKIGKLKSIEVSVQAIQSEDVNMAYINFRKDCGNDYYYSWEDAKLLPEECKYLIDTISEIKSNATRETDHEERYAYITKDDMRLFAVNEGGKTWRISFSVDYRKDRSEVTLSDAEIENLVTLINQGEKKVKELSK